MGQRRPFHQGRRQNAARPPIQVPPESPRTREKVPPKVYGKPFILLENEHKQTFEFQSGAWVAFTRTIAECRTDCQVKELTQKVNKMTRYEVRREV